MNHDYSLKERAVFTELVSFVNSTERHNGLYLLMGNVDEIYRVTFGISKKDDRFLPEYRGRHISTALHGHLERHSEVADGAIVLDPDGIVLDDHRFVTTARYDEICEEAKTGAGNVFLASATVESPEITAFVCSSEKPVIKTYARGKLIRGLYHVK